MKEIDQEEISRRRGIYFQSFGIYGGISGLYDYGPFGSLIKDRIVNIWKETLFREGNVAEFDGTALTHIQVLKSSGHYDRFFDYSVQCEQCGAKYRADELLEKYGIEVKLDPRWLDEKITEMGLKCERCGGKLGEVKVHKLMFPVEQGSELDPLYLRPETAQGIFINFKEYYRFFREKLPFAVIQTGRGYRNEISPRRALYRLREFNMMECESFFDPEDEMWPSEPDSTLNVRLSTRDGREIITTPMDAYRDGIIESQPIAYFIGLGSKFFRRIGIDGEKLRFRQHRKDELSHYSSDTWDAEADTSIGLVEIAGIAHRGTYDVSNHIKFSGKDLYGQRIIPKKKMIKKNKVIDYGKIRKDFRGNIEKVISAIESGNDSLNLNGTVVKLQDYYTINEEEVTVDRENFIPSVIEPSFGLDRILFSILDHNFSVRDDTGYIYLRIPSEISPYDVAVLPLMNKDDLDNRGREIFRHLLDVGLKVIYDESGTIGKRYARYDEVGVTYCVTIDYESLDKGDVTLRHRDTMKQIRINSDDIEKYVRVNPWNGRDS
jgi:glycyl-tRNA synthetase